jgi:hypothetical protein
MKNPSQSIFVFGIYVLLVGLSLFLLPNFVTGVFALPATSEPWIRALGAVAIALAGYYIQASRDNNIPYYRMSVWGRVVFSVLVVVIAVTTPDYLNMGLFAVVDLLGAAWTWYALR